jgi:hypothetical protein
MGQGSRKMGKIAIFFFFFSCQALCTILAHDRSYASNYTSTGVAFTWEHEGIREGGTRFGSNLGTCC